MEFSPAKHAFGLLSPRRAFLPSPKSTSAQRLDVGMAKQAIIPAQVQALTANHPGVEVYRRNDVAALQS